jgi:4'-phosphopantetheinyl transferase
MSQSININGSNFQIDAVLALPEDEVHLWRADLDGLGAEEFHWQALLASDESARASRFHFLRDRQRFVAGRALLRTILAGYLSADPKEINFCYSKREKPSLGPPHSVSNIRFNLSHSGGIALFAFTRHREVGVDVEQVRGDSDVDAISRRFFSAHEQHQLASFTPEERPAAFFRCWTRKEAYIKATGDGLALPLSQFDVSLRASNGNALLHTRPDASEASLWHLQEVPAGPGYTAALCVRGQNWKLKDWRSACGI